MNKKAVGIIMGTIIFIVIVLIAFTIYFLFVFRAGTNISVIEQVHAKEITLVLDKAKPGMKIELNMTGLYEIASDNDFNGKIVKIDNSENSVKVQLVRGKCYKYFFYNDADTIKWNLKGVNLVIEVVE